PPTWKVLLPGAIVCLVHLALVLSLFVELHHDRAVLPRAWARALPVDPNDPLRGRYIELQLAVAAPDASVEYGPARLGIRGSELIAEPAPPEAAYSRRALTDIRFAGRFNGTHRLPPIPPAAVPVPVGSVGGGTGDGGSGAPGAVGSGSAGSGSVPPWSVPPGSVPPGSPPTMSASLSIAQSAASSASR